MSHDRLPWGPLLLFGVVALVTRAVAALILPDPPYLDPAYYELVARRLAAGDGFSVPVLWSFLEVGGQLPPDAGLPIPSNRHWMPLTSVLGAAGIGIFGSSRLAAELPMIVLGSALVPLTGLVSWLLWPGRRNLYAAMLLALFAGPMLLYLPMAEAFAPFGVAGSLAILLSIMAVRRPRGGPWLLAAGVAVGLATLTRIDGVLLAAAPAVAWMARRRLGPWATPLPPIGVGWLAAAAFASILVVAPWLARQWVVFGSPLPSAGGHTLWITSYNEQFSIGHPVDLNSYLAWGPGNIALSKVASWGVLVGRTAVVLGGVFIVPFVIGLWRERRRAEVAPFAAYFAVMFLLMGGLFTFHAPQGAYYHSAWAWLPFAIPLAVASFGPTVAALGRRWSIFARERNATFLLRAGLAGAVALSIIGSAALAAEWRAGRERLETAASFIEREARSTDVVMYVDPPSLHLVTGNPIVALPFDPPNVIGSVASAYGARWLVVERLPGAVQDPLGLWNGAAWLAETPSLDTELVRVYEVATLP